MEKGGDKSNKILIGVLVVLILIIVGLIIGIIVVRLNESSAEPTAVEEEEEIVVNENDLDEGETVEGERERLALKSERDKEFRNIENEVDKLLDKDPVDMDAINALYDSGIQKAMEYESYAYVFEFIKSRTDKLTAKGLKREALDALLTVNYDMFGNVEKYRFYNNIVILANEVGDKKVANEYMEKRNKYEADFIADMEATRNFTESIGVENGLLIEEDNE